MTGGRVRQGRGTAEKDADAGETGEKLANDSSLKADANECLKETGLDGQVIRAKTPDDIAVKVVLLKK